MTRLKNYPVQWLDLYFGASYFSWIMNAYNLQMLWDKTKASELQKLITKMNLTGYVMISLVNNNNPNRLYVIEIKIQKYVRETL